MKLLQLCAQNQVLCAFPLLTMPRVFSDPSVRSLFRKMTTSAMSANLRMQTCDVFDVELLEVCCPAM
jgi:hypothetical protein